MSVLLYNVYQNMYLTEKRSKWLLAEALKEGFIRLMIMVCAIVGLAGVGKTHLKLLLLEEPPPHLRSSTICAESPVRIEIRNISRIRIQNVQGKWKEVGDEGMMDFVARMILLKEGELDAVESEDDQSEEEEKESKKKRKGNVLKRIFEWIKGEKKPATSSEDTTTPPILESCRKAMTNIMDSLVERISKLRDETHPDDIVAHPRGKIVISSKLIYLTDSGGQPSYHELLPLFVRHISTLVCVSRLTDDLNKIQRVELYEQGKRVGSSHLSQLTSKDTIKSLVSSVQSHSTPDHPTKILLVSTHLDKLEESIEQASTTGSVDDITQTTSDRVLESIKEKNKDLLELLEPEFTDQLVYYSSDMKQLLFPVNTLNPGEKDKVVAQSIRQAIENSGSREIKVPIWWYILELLLHELAKELGRGVLSHAECMEMSRLIGIQDDSFNAALEFFNKLNVIKYLPTVLPNVVFIDSQVPLDKISELVRHSFWLRQPSTSCIPSPIDGEWKHFRDQGVVTLQCLKKFDRHYVPGIFSIDDLCELFNHLLIFAPIPTPIWVPKDKEDAPSKTPKEKYFVMPALLLTLSEAELDKYRVSSHEIAPLLIRFPCGSRRSGVFCCFVVYLIRHCGWDLLLSAKEPLHRNCIKLLLRSSPPCTVTLIDSNAYVEIHVKLTANVQQISTECTKLLALIKQSIFGGISAACLALKYKQTKPEITFFCPHPRATTTTIAHSAAQCAGPQPQPHTATLTDDKRYLCCDVDPDISSPLEAEHLVWFGHAKGT